MSILSELFGDAASLLFPRRCAVCGEPLARGERTVCTLCRATAPLTGYWREADNPVFRKCWGLVPVERASGFLFFVRGSGWRRLIHAFKYRGAWRAAREMGAWYGRCLKESGLYDDVEAVVPLPLHPFKRCRRGYNQSEYIAEGIAGQLGVEVDRRSVGRKRNTASQAARAAGGRRDDHGQHAPVVRGRDAARRARLPRQHRGPGRLAPRAGGEGVAVRGGAKRTFFGKTPGAPF